MPTGYTYTIKDGITFKEFIMKCARAVGACIEMRDDPMDKPIPEKFEPSTYHLENIERYRRQLNQVQLMTDAEIESLEEHDRLKEIESIKQSELDRADLKLKYEDMLEQVKEWIPPSPDHENFKKFMLDQITESIEHDCDTSYRWPAPQKKSVDQWRADRIKDLERDIAYHTKENDEELKRYIEKNRWIQQLRQSIEKLPKRSRYEMLKRA